MGCDFLAELEDRNITLPETNIAHENPIFPDKYHQNGGFSMAMLVYRSVLGGFNFFLNMFTRSLGEKIQSDMHSFHVVQPPTRLDVQRKNSANFRGFERLGRFRNILPSGELT